MGPFKLSFNDLAEDRNACHGICLFCMAVPTNGRGTKNVVHSTDSVQCSPPREYLVKGERFIRVEENPELPNSKCT